MNSPIFFLLTPVVRAIPLRMNGSVAAKEAKLVGRDLTFDK